MAGLNPDRVLLGLMKAGGELPSPVALSPAEDQRLKRMLVPNRAAQYLAGRWLLRRLCALVTGLDMGAVALNASGMPVAEGPPADARPLPSLSLSHSGDWVLGAACFGACGVDIEQRGTSRDWPGLARYLGMKDAGSEETVLRHWTRFEARYKALYPAEPAVWSLEAPGYTGCLVAPRGLAVDLHYFSEGLQVTVVPEIEPAPKTAT